ncbi:kelch repeat-containing protein [Enterobacter cloacae]|uniref:kelch repeat-containing protein n=1 Tax=Enterobacter cloacae TaxID=550 RepID=UPI002FF47161
MIQLTFILHNITGLYRKMLSYRLTSGGCPVFRKYLPVSLFVFSFVTHALALPLFPVMALPGSLMMSFMRAQAVPTQHGTGLIRTRMQRHEAGLPSPPFSYGPREQATSVYINGGIYVFGGISKDDKGRSYVCNDIHRFDPARNVWETLNSRSPVGLAGHVTFISHNKVFLTDGVNGSIYNDYIKAIAAAGNDTIKAQSINQAYFRKKQKTISLTRRSLLRSVTEQWHYESESPSGGTAGAVVITDGDKTYLINGEQKLGLRTDSVMSLTVTNGSIHWERVPDVSSPDGTAGAFAATSRGVLIYSRGTFFEGPRKNYSDGKYYAHQGLNKSCSNAVHVVTQSKWAELAKLHLGRAYGVSLPWHDGL